MWGELKGNWDWCKWMLDVHMDLIGKVFPNIKSKQITKERAGALKDQ